MLARSCSEMGAGVMESMIEHDMKVISCFAKEQFGKRMVIGYHSGGAIHTNLYGDMDVEKR